MNEKQTEAQQKEDEEAARALEKRIDNMFAELSDSQRGRELFWWLLKITQDGVNAFGPNALVQSFTLGEQNVGKQILARLLRVAPEGYIKMLKEKL